MTISMGAREGAIYRVFVQCPPLQQWGILLYGGWFASDEGWRHHLPVTASGVRADVEPMPTAVALVPVSDGLNRLSVAPVEVVTCCAGLLKLELAHERVLARPSIGTERFDDLPNLPDAVDYPALANHTVGRERVGFPPDDDFPLEAPAHTQRLEHPSRISA